MYEDIVDVIRYIRPSLVWWDGEFAQNMWGISICYKVDYIEEVVTAKWSLCSNENFSKGVGVTIAGLRSTPSFSFPLSRVGERKGLTNALITELAEFIGVEDSDVGEDYGTLHVVFKEATRKLKAQK